MYFSQKVLRAKSSLPKNKNIISAITHLNSNGKISEAVGKYEDLKRSGHVFTKEEYNNILASFAPRKLMFKWFQPYKDYVDMYFEAGKFKPKEV
jgi:hypothetical protein